MKKVFAILIGLGALVVLIITLVHALYFSPGGSGLRPPGQSTTAAAAVSATEYPDRLIIPSLGINAAVQYVGVRSNGEMGIPSNFTDVAWYKYGTVPGQTGSAVIDGHVDNALSLPGVFKHLSDIKVGDDVYVVKKDGTKLDFKVVDLETYPYTNGPIDKIFNKSDGIYLNLITCQGTWVQSQRSYTNRLVVYTKLAQTLTR